MILNYFKHKKDHKRFMYLHPLILSVAFDMAHWCEIRNLPFVITSTVSTHDEDKKLKRRSKTHVSGRAFDMSLRDWSEKDINLFRTEYNKRYSNIASISTYTGQPTLIVRHNSGHGDHLHIQIHSKFSKNIELNAQKPKKSDVVQRDTLPLIAKQ